MRTIYLFKASFAFKIFFALVLSISLYSPQIVKGQDEPPCPDFTSNMKSDLYHEIDFGESLTFHLCWNNIEEVESASIQIEIENFDEPLIGTVDAPADAKSGDLINLNHQLNLAQTLISPFSNIEYVWTLQYKSGRSEKRDPVLFEYRDTRVEWQTTGSGAIEVHSEAQHRPIAEIALDIIQTSLPAIETVIPVNHHESAAGSDIDVYLYPDHQTFQSTLRLTGLDWVAGKASPKIGVILIPITSGTNEAAARNDLEQRLPHELSHMLIYRATGAGYSNLPSWFDEGVATSFEAVTNPNYALSLANVTDSSQLIPFSEMCVNLPIQPPEMALRGYAQSHALVNYIKTKHGPESIQKIILAAANGANCEDAVIQITGQSGDALAQEWLSELQPGPLEPGSPLRTGLFLIVGLFVLISIILWTRTYGTRTISEFNG